jgi:acetyltransferase
MDDLTPGSRASTLQDIRSAVADVIATVAPETDKAALAPDRPLREQVELDSIDWVNVVEALCERLQVDIPEADYGRLTTIDAIAACVEARRKARASGEPAAPSAASTEDLPFVCHVIDGARVTVRPIRASDAGLEETFVEGLSSDSRYERFMVTLRALPSAKLKYLTDVDQVRHVAIVATTDRDGQEAIVGAARYALLGDAANGCEFAVAVDDAWKGSGLAGVLMHALMNLARRRGIKVMEGTVLSTNSAMLKFMRQLGFRREPVKGDAQVARVVRAL